MIRSLRPILFRGMFAVALLGAATRVQADPVSSQSGNFKYKADKITLTNNGVKLEGNAEIVSPQLEVRAAAIAFDFAKNQITQVRARGKVNMKVAMVPKKDAAAATTGPAVVTRVEANCEEADLDPPQRRLELRGKVDGYYQVGDGPRTLLGGTKVVATYVDNMPNVAVDGPVSVTIPPEKGTTAPIGTVVITSRSMILDQKTGEIRFVGDVHAVSKDGANKFDVAAPQMAITRGADNTINTLKTIGRTQLHIDLPPEPVATAAAANTPGITATPGQPAIATPPPVAAAAGTAPAMRDKVGKPTHVDVEADSANVNRATSVMVFEGNVVGAYFLSAAAGEPQRYDFSGSKATISYIPESQATKEKPAGLKADIVGAPNKPVEVLTPLFNLDLGG